MYDFCNDATFNQFLYSASKRRVSYFKSILMFLRQCMSQPWEKAHFLPVPSSPTAGQRVSLSSLCTSGKMRGEKNKKWTSAKATLSTVWKKIAGLVTLHGNKESLRKYSTSRRLSCQKISHLQVTGP